MNKETTCRGKVARISSDGIVITPLEDASACAGCAAASMCGHTADSAGEIVLPADAAAGLRPGQEVIIATAESARWSAVTVCFVIPVVLVGLGCAGALLAGASEAVAAVMALALPSAYFLLLYLMRRSGRAPWEKNVWKLKSIIK